MIQARPDTTAYIVSILADRKLSDLVICDSVVLTYVNALAFEQKRKFADSILFSEIIFAGWHKQPELCVELARRCYESCWNTLRPHWPLYEELANRLPEIVKSCRDTINHFRNEYKNIP